MRKFLHVTFTLIWFVPLVGIAQNAAQDENARQIFEEVDRRRESITFETADMQMIIYDSRGRTRNRQIQSFSYNKGETSKTLLIFEEPGNVRGTGFLTLSENSDEVQKLFLPALGRIKIISASEKSDRFMGSDFTYEDLGDREPEDYNFQMEAETDTSYVLRAEKKGQSQYAWIHFYIHPERYLVQQIEYFNEQGEMIKRLETANYEEVKEDVWQANFMVMHDLVENRKTELKWSNRQIDEPIADWRFTDRGLRRGTD
ncbi:outer membrane lipoprotein-sorting protein [Aliifodinibius sp. S!AR15-10]|uniref:outer membrane lipoprotein-sorting protein n=1 Tax=Aliifodinibius sp. S!AR15-10 TaxID=2950437 RepID=UPI00285EF56A|nr:outer membrane lipoprotein-sorting protein [Aliifodinibius sp. S!AR15-10]MDR8391712.1 outer membrane lipoprotein-sorting protein [Aliifodinibius sp. S!AR15-10]